MSYHLIKAQYQKNKIGWRKSFLDSFAQDDQGLALPWMTYPFIEFIGPQLNCKQQIFEFGCGSSTFYFAKKVAKVVSLETNAKWCEIMKIKLRELNINNVEIILMTDGLENSEYENYIKNSAQKFNFIIVDSLKRYECVKNSYEFLKPGGALILDDSERKGYKKIFEFMEEKSFVKQDFPGIAPGQFKLKNTTLFQKL